MFGMTLQSVCCEDRGGQFQSSVNSVAQANTGVLRCAQDGTSSLRGRWRKLFDLFYLDRVRLLIQSAENFDALAFVSLCLSLIVQLITQVSYTKRITCALFDDCSGKGAWLSCGFGLP